MDSREAFEKWAISRGYDLMWNAIEGEYLYSENRARAEAFCAGVAWEQSRAAADTHVSGRPVEIDTDKLRALAKTLDYPANHIGGSDEMVKNAESYVERSLREIIRTGAIDEVGKRYLVKVAQDALNAMRRTPNERERRLEDCLRMAIYNKAGWITKASVLVGAQKGNGDE
jgi:hypothetical protein